MPDLAALEAALEERQASLLTGAAALLLVANGAKS
jgi:hypothetical protein